MHRIVGVVVSVLQMAVQGIKLRADFCFNLLQMLGVTYMLLEFLWSIAIIIWHPEGKGTLHGNGGRGNKGMQAESEREE